MSKGKYKKRGKKSSRRWFKKLDPFYLSNEWLELRKRVLGYWGAKCMVCGRTRKDGVMINVDHIKPRKLWPSLSLDFDNMGVLCGAHNKEKGNKDWGDYRPQDKAKARPVHLTIQRIGPSIYDLDDEAQAHMKAIIGIA